MTRPVIGIDTAKEELVIQHDDEKRHLAVDNTPAAIRQWLAGLPKGCDIAIEATSTYHMEITERAHAKGHHVYVVDGYRLKNYREGVGGRAKTDLTDAQLLARYLRKEKDELRRWMPPPKAYRTLQSLLRRRAALVKARTALRQSLSAEPLLKTALATLLKQIDRIDHLIQKRLREAVHAAGLRDHVEGEVFFERAAFAETLELGIDDAGVDRLHHVIGQAQPLDRAGGEVLHHHVRLTDHVLDQIEALGRLQIDGDRFLIGVEEVKIIRIIVQQAGLQAAAGIAHIRILDLHHLGAEPGKGFGA